MRLWSQRMAEARRRAMPDAIYANSLSEIPIGTNGTVGRAHSRTRVSPDPEQTALLALSAEVRSAKPTLPAWGAMNVDSPAQAHDLHGSVAATGTCVGSLVIASKSNADMHRAQILRELDCLPPAADDYGRRLLQRTRSFLNSPLWKAALKFDWTPLELFGIDDAAPLSRTDAQGLVTSLALRTLMGGDIDEITDSRAVVCYRSGEKLTWCRGASGLVTAVLWWRCSAIIGDPDSDLDRGAA